MASKEISTLLTALSVYFCLLMPQIKMIFHDNLIIAKNLLMYSQLGFLRAVQNSAFSNLTTVFQKEKLLFLPWYIFSTVKEPSEENKFRLSVPRKTVYIWRLRWCVISVKTSFAALSFPCHRNLLVHKTFTFPQMFQQLGLKVPFRDKCVYHIYSLKFNLEASLD